MVKRASSYVLLFFTGLLTLLTFLLATPWGTHLTLLGVNQISFISLEYKEGNIVNGVGLEHFSLTLDSATIEISEPTISLKLACLTTYSICVKDISANHLLVKVSSSAEQQTNNPSDEQVYLPFPIKVENLSLENATIKTDAVDILVKKFSTLSKLNNNQFTFTSTHANRIDVILNHSDIEETQAANKWPLASLPKIYLPIYVDISEFSNDVLFLRQEANDAFEHDFSNLTFTGSWVGTEVKVREFSISYPQIGSANLNGQISLVHPYQLNIEANTHIAQLGFWPQLSNSNQILKLKGSFEDLSTQLSSTGSLALNAIGLINLTQDDLPFEINLKSNKLPKHQSYSNAFEMREIDAKAKGTMEKVNFDLNTVFSGFGYQNASLEMNGNIDESSISVKALNLVDETSNGNLSVVGNFNLEDNIKWNVALTANQYKLPDLSKLENIESDAIEQLFQNQDFKTSISRFSGFIEGNINSEGKLNLSSINNNIEEKGQFTPRDIFDNLIIKIPNSHLSGEVAGSTFLVEANVDLQSKGRLSPSHLNLSVDNRRLSLEGYSDKNWHLKLNIDEKDLSFWSPQIKGSLSSKLFVTGAIYQPKIKFNTHLRDLSIDNIQSSEVNFKGEYQPITSNTNSDLVHDFTVLLNTRQIHIDDLLFDDIELNAHGDINKQVINFSNQGVIPSSFSLENQWDATSNVLKAVFHQAQIGYEDISLNHSSTKQLLSVDFNLNNYEVSLSSHCWQGNTGTICFEDLVQKDHKNYTLAADVDLQTQALDHIFVPEDFTFSTGVKGKISVDFNTDGLFEIDSNFDIVNGNVSLHQSNQSEALLNWQNGKLKIQANNHILHTDLSLYKSNETKETDPRVLKFAGQVNLGEPKDISGQIFIDSLTLAPLAIFSHEITTVQAEVSSAIEVSGTLYNPIINGKLQLENGTMKLLRGPLPIENISLIANFNNTKATVDGTFAIEQKKAELKSTVDWSDAFKVNANFITNELPVLYPPNLEAKVSSNINANLENNTLTLSGNLDLLSGNLTLEKLPEDSVDISDDVVFVDNSGVEITQSQKLAIKTDLDISISDKFKLTAQGFEGNLRGNIKVAQMPKQPVQLFGDLTVLNGNYRAFGQHLVVEKGRLDFNGTPDNPLVNLRAIRQIKSESVTAGIEVTGLADNLSITLFSNPSMEQSEILSYIVRGRGLDAETNNNAALAIALGSTLSKAAGFNDRIREMPLLTDISVDAEVDGDQTMATISGYIGDRVYLKYGRGIYEPLDEITVRLYILSQLWLETISGLEDSVDIYYSFDID